MGLEIPDLDDWTFEEAIEDARKQLPVHSDDWTDHNVHDPGITILEALAWVAQTQTYQLDQVTDAHRRKYLELLGDTPRPPTQASVDLSVTLDPDTAPTLLPAGTSVEAIVGPDDIEHYTTDAPVALTDATLERVVTEGSFGRNDLSRANRSESVHFPFFGPEAAVGSTCYLGFDSDPFVDVDVPAAHAPVNESVGDESSTEVGSTSGSAPGTGDQPRGSDTGESTEETIRPRFDLHVEYYDADLPDPAEHGDVSGGYLEPTVDVDWSYCMAPSRWYADDAWGSLDVVFDETNSLYEGGTIGFAAPPDYAPTMGPFPGDDRDLLWIRCVLDDAGYESPPRCTRLATNVVRATHRTIHRDDELVRQDADVPRDRGADETGAWPSQRFEFDVSPVQSAVVTVGGDSWGPVDSLDASAPDDRHYVLDHAAGELRFGDGDRGEIPAPGQTVRAEWYVEGGGPRGNVSQDATWQFAGPPGDAMAVNAISDATGGREAETIADALERVTRDMETPYRAVTRADYAYVATHTPGLRFGRARALVPDSEDEERGECAAPTPVRVVVVPASTRDRPAPSDGFMAAVQRHLCEHALLTDRVTVTGPTYVDVSVTAVVELREDGDPASIETDIRDALDDFLHPLHGYDGDGWPFGRPVYQSELYETVANVTGVDCVRDIDIVASGRHDVDAVGNLPIPNGALLAPGDHVVEVETTRGDCGGR